MYTALQLATQLRLDDQAGRQQVTKLLMRLFDKWHLQAAEKLILLGANPSSRAILTKYKKGERAIANDYDKLIRAGLILAIHKALRQLFPEDSDICYGWVKMPNKAFANKEPLEIMQEPGQFGLAKVYIYLERALVM